MFVRLGLVCLLFAAVAQAGEPKWQPPEVPVTEVAPRPAKVLTVNCAQGQSLQAAIDANAGPMEIAITGICVENVVIRDKDISLRGTSKASLNGIRSATSAMPALTVRGSVIGSITNLSFSNSAGTAVLVRGATPTISNCLFENNGGSGLQVNLGAFVTADSLTFNGNIGRGINASDAQVFCTGCDISGNNFAVLATRGAIVSLLDGVVTGRRGILAVDAGTIADIDCLTAGTSHPCSMQVTGVAAQAVGGAVASLFATGDFTGQVTADDRGTVFLIGARQTAGARPGQGPDVNVVDFFGMIAATALFDVDPPAQSLLRSTAAAHFGRVLITDDTIVNGAIQCTSAADAWLDRTVIALPGSTVTGCDHGSLP
jgi:hypothetical protein